MFDIVGFHIPHIFQKLTKHTCHDTRLYSKLRTEEENDQIEKFMSSSEKIDIDLKNMLLPSDVRTILRSEDELSQAISWSRIFPAHNTSHLLQLIPSPSYSNIMLSAWEVQFGTCIKEREAGQEMVRKLCNEKYHLKLPEIMIVFPNLFIVYKSKKIFVV